MADHSKDFLTNFKLAKDSMITTNSNTYRGNYDINRLMRLKDYTLEEIQNVINYGSLREQRHLSRNYFCKDGFYKQILLHYANLLKYAGVLVPIPGFG